MMCVLFCAHRPYLPAPWNAPLPLYKLRGSFPSLVGIARAQLSLLHLCLPGIAFSMALSNSFTALLLLFFILAVHLVDSRPTLDHRVVMSNGRSLLQAPAPAIDCGSKCAVRCSKSWKPKMCNKMCGVCCSKCSCVPPGTSAETRAMCPCYANMRNPKGQLKCP